MDYVMKSDSESLTNESLIFIDLFTFHLYMYTGVNETIRQFYAGDPFMRRRTTVAIAVVRLEDEDTIHLWTAWAQSPLGFTVYHCNQ
jgi:hypothetical protein